MCWSVFTFGNRLKARRQFLALAIEVRILVPERAKWAQATFVVGNVTPLHRCSDVPVSEDDAMDSFGAPFLPTAYHSEVDVGFQVGL